MRTAVSPAVRGAKADKESDLGKVGRWPAPLLIQHPAKDYAAKNHCCPVAGGILVTGRVPEMEAATISRITVEPGKRGGKPCIRGIRITVWDVLGWLGAGMTEDQILDEHPDL